MNACQIDRESHLQNDVRNVQILQKMQCTNEYNEHDAQSVHNDAHDAHSVHNDRKDCNDCKA